MTVTNFQTKIIFGLLFLLLSLSCWINFYLFQVGRGYYLELNDTRLHPLGLHYYADGNTISSDSSTKPRVLFLGDSRTAQWPVPKGFDSLEFANRGIGAQTTAQVLGRYNAHVAPLQPDILILQVGINDLKTIPLFPGRKREIVTTCKNNIQQIVQQSLQRDTTVILTTIFPLGKLPLVRRPFWSSDVAEAIDDVNQFLVSLQGEHVKIFDTSAILATETTVVNSNYSADFLHLNSQGYEALNQELSNILHNIGTSKR